MLFGLSPLVCWNLHPMALHSPSFTKFTLSLCRTLLPPLSNCIAHGAVYELTFESSISTYQGLKFFIGSSSRSYGGAVTDSSPRMRRRSVTAMATSPQRWTLDDVERISRGKASKAKTGSRAVPHRLQAGERKAYDLAKKKGYLVQRAVSRKYPLINTYRNFCDASSQICIFIQQGHTGFDTVVIDLTPLRLSGDTLLNLTDQVNEVVQTTFRERIEGGEEDVDEKEFEGEDITDVQEEENVQEEEGIEGEKIGILRFTAGRADAKTISQAAWDFWQCTVKSGKMRVSE